MDKDCGDLRINFQKILKIVFLMTVREEISYTDLITIRRIEVLNFYF